MRTLKWLDYCDVVVTAACIVWIAVSIAGCSSAPVSRVYHPTEGYCVHPGVMEGANFTVGPDAEIEGSTLRYTNEAGTEQTELTGATCVLKRKK